MSPKGNINDDIPKLSEGRRRLTNTSCEDPPMAGFQEEHWLWNFTDRSPQVMLSSNHRAAYFHTDPVDGSTGSAGVRGTKGFVDGEHYWEIRFLEPPHGTSVMIGIATKDALLHTDNSQFVNLIGRDRNSWGLSYKGSIWHGGKSWSYCRPFYDEDTAIGVHLNLYKGTLSYYQDGQYLGVAFTGLNQINKEVFPVIASTATHTELELENCTCRYLSLQEKCFLKVARQLQDSDAIQTLSLPQSFKNHLKAMVAR